MSRQRGTPDSGQDPSLEDEAELIRRCRLGERAAHEEFYRLYRRRVAANIYRIMNDSSDLEDLVQEVFVIAFRGLDKFRGESRLSTWLYRICINVGLGRIRSRARRPLPIPVAEPEPDTSAVGPETPERALQRQQAHERVYRALDAMSDKKRIVFYLHEIEGHDLTEIAETLEINPVTARTRLFYARREFYKRIARGDAE